MRFFFYGSLMDAEVRAIVLGPHMPVAIDRAVLSGWRRCAARGKAYPVILRALGHRVEGLLARGIDRDGMRRLCLYEDDGYSLVRVSVNVAGRRRAIEAWAFAARANAPRGRGTAWSLARWQRRHKRGVLPRLKRWAAAALDSTSSPPAASAGCPEAIARRNRSSAA